MYDSFLHSSNSNNNRILKYITNEFQSNGYAVYFKLKEILVRSYEYFFIAILEGDKLYKEIARELGGIRSTTVKKVMDRLSELDYLAPELYEKGVVFSPEVVRNFGDYTKLGQKSVLVLYQNCNNSALTLLKLSANFYKTQSQTPEKTALDLYNIIYNIIYNININKYNIIKEPEDKKNKLNFYSNSWEHKTAKWLLDAISRRVGSKFSNPEATLGAWAESFAELKAKHVNGSSDVDKVKEVESEIEKVIRHSQENEFFAKIVKTPKPLLKTEFYSQILISAIQGQKTQNNGSNSPVEHVIAMIRDIPNDAYGYHNISIHGTSLPAGRYFMKITHNQDKFDKMDLDIKFYDSDEEYKKSSEYANSV